MSIITFLVIGSTILHKGTPEITESEFIYEDIIYPIFLLEGYEFVTDEAEDDINVYMYFWNGTNIELKDPPPTSLVAGDLS